ncbi:MAG: hypothetical protein K0S63_986, partial [Gammaproteobacteria bacterium]|nr:hypothetical protein [Gammaproteobacteria bacterium]
MPTPTAKSYKEIARQYADYNDPQGESKNADISPWKYFFTDVFYRGKYARYALRDWLAGGVKNNFLFGLFPKSDHAEFIAVIDCICKLKKGDYQKLLVGICDLDIEKYKRPELPVSLHNYLYNSEQESDEIFFELESDKKLKEEFKGYLEESKQITDDYLERLIVAPFLDYFE